MRLLTGGALGSVVSKRPARGADAGSRPARPTRVLVVDDHRAFSEALAMAIDLQDDIECVGVASTVSEALELVVERAPDVVLMDVYLPDIDGIEGTGRVKALRPETRVLVLTAHTNAETMARAASAGASGFLPKESPIAEILRAIATASEGGMLVDHSTLAVVLERLRESERKPPEPGARFPEITQREREVLGLMGEGLDPQGIAKRLGMSIHTSRGHVKSILRKLEVHSQLEAVVTAVRQGLLPGLSG